MVRPAVRLIWLGLMLGGCVSSGPPEGEVARRPPPAPVTPEPPPAEPAALVGHDAALRLRVDARITSASETALRNYYWYGHEMAGGEDLVQRPLEDAVLLSAQGERPLGTPFARLERVDLGEEAYVLSLAMGGFGQFNGTLASVLTTRQDRPEPLAAIDAVSGAAAAIELRRAARTDWRLRGQGVRTRILQVLCQADEVGPDGFRERYVTYAVDGGAWTRTERSGWGYCDWAGEFPPDARFP